MPPSTDAPRFAFGMGDDIFRPARLKLTANRHRQHSIVFHGVSFYLAAGWPDVFAGQRVRRVF